MNNMNANQLLNMSNLNMANIAQLGNLQPQAMRELQQRLFLARQQQQQQQNNNPQNPGMQ